jgi:hypothetical protein
VIREFLRSKAKHANTPRPVVALLRAELRKLEKRAVKKKSIMETRRFFKAVSRWAAFKLLMNYGRSQEEALALAAQAYGKGFDKGVSTIDHGYKEIVKYFRLAPGARDLPPQRGGRTET